MPYDRAVRALARQQGGVLTRADARRLGLTPAQIATAVRSGRWQRVTYGALAPVTMLPPPGPARAALEVAAALRVGDPRMVPVDETAALMHGLPLIGPVPRRPRLVLPACDDLANRHDVSPPRIPRSCVTRLHGVPVTTLGRTVVDVARYRGLPSGLVAADAALRRGLASAELDAAVDACAGWPGITSARRAARLARLGSESPLESLGRLALVEAGLPEPELQVQVHDRRGFVGRVDQLWRQQRVVGEADGLGKYTDAGSCARRSCARTGCATWAWRSSATPGGTWCATRTSWWSGCAALSPAARSAPPDGPAQMSREVPLPSTSGRVRASLVAGRTSAVGRSLGESPSGPTPRACSRRSTR